MFRPGCPLGAGRKRACPVPAAASCSYHIGLPERAPVSKKLESRLQPAIDHQKANATSLFSGRRYVGQCPAASRRSGGR